MSSYIGVLRIGLAALALLGALTGVTGASAQNVTSCRGTHPGASSECYKSCGMNGTSWACSWSASIPSALS